MTTYRAYCLDAQGSIGLANWFKASTNQDAIEKARLLYPDAHKCELWRGRRLIGRIDDEGRWNEASFPGEETL